MVESEPRCFDVGGIHAKCQVFEPRNLSGSPDGALFGWIHLAAGRTLVGFGEVVRVGQRTDHSVNTTTHIHFDVSFTPFRTFGQTSQGASTNIQLDVLCIAVVRLSSV